MRRLRPGGAGSGLADGVAEYRGEDGKESFRLPEKRYGVAFVFRVFERVAYALVMESDGPVTIGDTVRKP